MSKRSSLFWLVLLAPLAWGGLLLFTYFVPPDSPLMFVLFFLLLIAALVSTFTLIAHMIGSYLFASRIYRSTHIHAFRQGVLLTAVVVLDLILRALHSWNIFVIIVIFAAAVLLEIISLARKS